MDSNSLRLCSWNLWFDHFHQASRIRAAMAELRAVQPDVVCLQEVTEPILQIILGEMGATPFAPLFDIHSSNPYGQMYLINTQTVKGIKFGSVHFPETRMNRRIYQLTLEKARKRMTVLNVHLESEFSGNARGTKAKQLDYLLEFASQLDPNECGTVIIAGDCNLAEKDKRWSQSLLKRYQYADIGPKTPTYDCTRNSNIIGQYCSRLDRIFVSNTARVQYVNHDLLGQRQVVLGEGPVRGFPSDHFGIDITLFV